MLSYAKKYGIYHPGHNSSIPMKPHYSSYAQNAFLGFLGQHANGVKKINQVINPAQVGMWVEETLMQISPESVPQLGTDLEWISG